MVFNKGNQCNMLQLQSVVSFTRRCWRIWKSEQCGHCCSLSALQLVCQLSSDQSSLGWSSIIQYGENNQSHAWAQAVSPPRCSGNLRSNRRKLFWVQPGITFSFYLPKGRQICGHRFASLCFLELLSRFHLDLHSSVAADTSLLGSQLSLISREGPEGLDMEMAKMCSEHMLASKDGDRIWNECVSNRETVGRRWVEKTFGAQKEFENPGGRFLDVDEAAHAQRGAI